jgi:hypothetical protein
MGTFKYIIIKSKVTKEEKAITFTMDKQHVDVFQEYKKEFKAVSAGFFIRTTELEPFVVRDMGSDTLRLKPREKEDEKIIAKNFCEKVK